MAELNGILCIDKPEGFTSFDVVAKLRGIAGTRRVGHAGTLDPMATGVLPLFFGRATKACDILPRQDKRYLADFKLGVTTDTQDSTGRVLRERDPSEVTEARVREAAARFTGEILQVPPMYSALRVEGKRLYELARQGVEVERKARPVTIRSLEVLSWDGAAHTCRIDVHCSKGTYIRTLCHDIGRQLGCGGTLYALRRTMAVGFRLEQAVTLEAVQAQGTALLLPTDSLFAEYPALPLTSGLLEKRVRCGNPIPLPGTPDGIYRVYSRDRQFLCLSRAAGGTLTSIKNFFGA